MSAAYSNTVASEAIIENNRKPEQIGADLFDPCRVGSGFQRRRELVKVLKTLLIAGVVTAPFAAGAAEVTGAGATFPAPVYSKWAEAYKKESGIVLTYQPIGSGGGIRQIQNKPRTVG